MPFSEQSAEAQAVGRPEGKRLPPPPLRVQLCYRRSAALARTLPAKRLRRSRQEAMSMLWMHRAWDLLHGGLDTDDPRPASGE